MELEAFQITELQTKNLAIDLDIGSLLEQQSDTH
jgi:hypothetical protein